METIEQQISGVQSINLHNHHLDVDIECLPHHGGRINRLQLNDGSIKKNIIAGFKSRDELLSDVFFRNVLLFPFVNRLDGGTWTYGNQQLHFPINETESNNALHGFLFNKALETRSTRNDEKGVEIVLGYDYRSEFSFYPFDIDIRVTYRIPAANRFELEFEITNVGYEIAPAGFGWHPYFTLEETVDHLELDPPPMRRVLVNDQKLPTGEKQPFNQFEGGKRIGDIDLDTCFVLDGARKTTLYSPGRHTALTIQQDQIFNYLQIFIPPNRESIAIEPVTSNINAFQTGEGLLRIEPHQKINATISVSINNKD